MTETGIYGGSFNPIHRGHVELAERLCRDEGLDELWFMVSPQNPFKKSSPDLLNENIRLELARMAVREHPCLKVSDFEFRLPRPSYRHFGRLAASLSRPAFHISHRCRQLACFQGLEETGRDSKPPSHLGLPPSRLRGGGRVPSPRCQAYGHPAHRHQFHRNPPSHLPRRRRLLRIRRSGLAGNPQKRILSESIRHLSE